MKKSLTGVTIKDAAQGLVEAVFSTYDVIDLDGDVTLKGALPDGAPVVISAYGHQSHVGALPVGYGTIHDAGEHAVLKGQFLLNTQHGRDTFETVKSLSEQGLQEWSYHLADVKSHRATIDGKSVRVIEKVGLVKEVSPVLRGAGIDTRTLTIKGADDATKQLASSLARLLSLAGRERWSDAWVWLEDYDLDEGYVVFGVETMDAEPVLLQVYYTRTDTAVTLGDTEIEVHRTAAFLPKSAKFAEHRDAALRSVKTFSAMAMERLALRAAEGKAVTEQVGAYDELVAELEPLKSAIDALATSQSTPSDDEIRREYLRFVGTTL